MRNCQLDFALHFVFTSQKSFSLSRRFISFIKPFLAVSFVFPSLPSPSTLNLNSQTPNENPISSIFYHRVSHPHSPSPFPIPKSPITISISHLSRKLSPSLSAYPFFPSASCSHFIWRFSERLGYGIRGTSAKGSVWHWEREFKSKKGREMRGEGGGRSGRREE